MICNGYAIEEENIHQFELYWGFLRTLDYSKRKFKEFCEILLFKYITLKRLNIQELKKIISKIIHECIPDTTKEDIDLILWEQNKDKWEKYTNKPNWDGFKELLNESKIDESDMLRAHNFIESLNDTSSDDKYGFDYLYVNDMKHCSAKQMKQIVWRICNNWDNMDQMKQYEDTLSACFEYYQLSGNEFLGIEKEKGSTENFCHMVTNFTSKGFFKPSRASFLKINQTIHEIDRILSHARQTHKSYPLYIFKSVKYTISFLIFSCKDLAAIYLLQ